MTRRSIDLFTGCGGASLGLLAAGYDVVSALDFDAKAVAVHRRIAGPAYVHDLAWISLAWIHAVVTGIVDIVWASPPCQPFSSAGARLGAADARDGYPFLLRHLDYIQPRWAITENVPGLAHHRRKGHDPSTCPGCYNERNLGRLRAMFAHVDQRVVDAASFGVPQHRKRLITVCGPAPYVWPTPTHGPGCSLPYVSAGEALGLTEGCSLAVGGPGASGGYGPRAQGLGEPAPLVRTHADIYLVAAGWQANGEHVKASNGQTYQRIRTLTVPERARLQCLPYVKGMTGKQVGNAAPPPMVTAICESVTKQVMTR